MDVTFITKNQGMFVMPCPEISPKHVIRFRRSYTTQRKDEIKLMLSNSYAQEKCELGPGQDLESIGDYLYSEERTDVMTKEYLNSIPFEAFKEIMEVRSDIQVRYPLVGIAKGTLEGKPLTSEIEEIVTKYKEGNPAAEAKQEEKKEQEAEKKEKVKIQLGKAKKKQSETEDEPSEGKDEVTAAKSGDLNARPAAEFIEAADPESLEGFLSEDEGRVTVLKAWNEKFEDDPDKQVELPE